MKDEVKFMSCFTVDNIKHIVKEVNNRNIRKDDLVNILYDNNQYYVLYYKS